MTGLPQGWTDTALGDVCELLNGRAYSQPELLSEGKYPVLRVGNLFSRNAWYHSDLELDPDKYIDSGDLIYAWSASFGPRIWQGGKVIYHYHIWKCALQDQAVDKHFLYNLLLWDTAKIKGDHGVGSTMMHVTKSAMEKRQIPLPPLPEQRRIVRKLDTLSARSTTARTHLTAIEKLVERYKSGVLGLELSGVPLGNEADEQNTQPITNDNERGAWTFKALPTHWVWTGFKAFLENQTDSYRKLPQKDYQSEGEYPVIDQGADLIGGYSNDATLLLPAEPPYIIFGDHTRCVKFFEAPFVQGADGVKVFHAGKDVDIRFAYWTLKALQLPDKGYSRHAKFLKESYFPRPPIDEQREIVRRIETAFTKIDRLAAEAAKALKLLGHLDQRILAKAFAGDLVPQDPTDEPAETLLARIRETRAAAPKSRRGRK
jgi:type I restriction enzyme S subunit